MPLAQEIVDFPTGGRAFSATYLVGPGASHPTGRIRLDALADWLQQVAYEDVLDARLEASSVWIVRRTRIRAQRLPVFGERVALRTACSGTGTLCAERRTTMTGDAGARVEAAAIWVPLDRETLRPAKSPGFDDVYLPSAGDRRVRARLRHPAPPERAAGTSWPFRVSDLDVAAHVNNAAYWRVFEEELADAGPDVVLDAEVEHHAPSPGGVASVVAEGERRWVLGPDGAVQASLVRDAAA